jgi:phosphoribosylglycinamide formyltransferase-1
LDKLHEYDVDLIVLAGYLAIIPDEIINLYENRIINIHPSLIPAFCGPGYYGVHVHEEAFARGVKVAGATVHFVSSVVDGGPIIMQKAIDVSNCNSPEEMQKKVLVEVEHQILPLAVKLYCEGKIKVVNGRVVL